MLKPFNKYRATVSQQQRRRTLLIWEMLKGICDDKDNTDKIEGQQGGLFTYLGLENDKKDWQAERK